MKAKGADPPPKPEQIARPAGQSRPLTSTTTRPASDALDVDKATNPSSDTSVKPSKPIRKKPSYDIFVVASTTRLNHNCILVELRAKDLDEFQESSCPAVDVFHINVKAAIKDAGDVVRPYTPLSSFDCYK